jgi:hypothetical protein
VSDLSGEMEYLFLFFFLWLDRVASTAANESTRLKLSRAQIWEELQNLSSTQLNKKTSFVLAELELT